MSAPTLSPRAPDMGVKELADWSSSSGVNAHSFHRLVVALFLIGPALRAAEPPVDVGSKNADTPGAPHYTNASVLMPDGRLESFFRVGLKEGITFFRMRSTDNGRTWSDKEKVVMPPKDDWGGPMPLLDRDGELHFIIPKLRGEGRKPAVDRFIDLFHMRSSNGRTQWTNPERIFEGYVGSFQGFIQMKSGRIIAPFGAWQAGVPVAPPFGSNVTTCAYSDDGGRTWSQSPAKLIAPCPEDTNGNCYGAVEPTLIELRDGRVWMLIRTEAGFLYESFSKDGAEWSPAQPSRFHSSHSPAFLLRLKDGRLVNFWNNCEGCPRVGKDGVYTGRDALHAAISNDDGKTWHGYREVYRDATRHGSPPKDGDRGTAYPHATETKDGRILLVSGQGAERRRRFLIDPEWLMEKSQTETFASIDSWHLFKGIGKPVRYWRDRVQGPQLIAHPDHPHAKVLHLRRPDRNDADGATWNFPAAQRGKLTLRLRIGKAFGGAQIGLTNRMFEPCDDNGEKLATYALIVPPDGRIADGIGLTPGQWHTLNLAWNDKGSCTVTIDDAAKTTLPSRAPAPDGLSYLRLRSLSTAVDTAGFLIESLNMTVQ